MKQYVKSRFQTFSFVFFLAAFTLTLSLAVKADASEYILPDSNSRYYSESEISDMTVQVVCYAKNEIYARRGRMFRSVELAGYFNEQSWYNGTIPPDQFSPSVFNDYELRNIDLLSSREQYLYSGGYPVDQPGYSYLPVYNYITGHNVDTLQNDSTIDSFSAETTDNAASDIVYGSDAVSIYLQILRRYETNIHYYNWQAYPEMNTYPNPSPMPVAFFDLTGDGVKELIFVEAPNNDYGYDPVIGVLHIYSWEYNQAREIYRSPQSLDHAVAGGCYYVIYPNLSTGGLSIFTSGGDENWTNTLTEHILGDDGLYHTVLTLEDFAYPDYDSPNYNYIHDYYRNEAVTSAEYYNAELQNSWANRGTVLMWSDYSTVSSALGIDRLPEMIAMTYNSAIQYLTYHGDDITSAYEDEIVTNDISDHISDSISRTDSYAATADASSLNSIYWGFMNDNQYLFTEQREDFWYGTYDIDRDGTPELFVRYPSGVRSALQIFTYSGGQVINILPRDPSYGDKAIYAAEEIMENGYDNSVCIGATGGAAYHYNTTYIKEGNSMTSQYVLFRDYSENKYTCDDQPISEDTYFSYMNPYYEAAIDFVSFY